MFLTLTRKDTWLPPARTMTIKSLPDEVLLEIFDCYRRTFSDQLVSERVWNNKNGWFKLAHVCHNWRSVVLASPSRLRLRLYFASNTPTRAVALERLLHLPIIVDYSSVIWKGSAPKRFTSALRYPARVCRIAIRGSNKTPDTIAEALDIPFPALESLELHSMTMTGIERVIRSPSFMTSIQSLRHLRLEGMLLTSVLPFLSVTRSLVDLTLNIDKVFLTKAASLLAHIQHMPHLRNLRVSSQPYFSQGSPPTTSIILPELTCFRFVGECTQVEWFVSGLDTPNLRKFHISIMHRSRGLDIPYLTKFISAVGVDFVTAQLTISGPCLRTDLFARSHSNDDPRSDIFTISTQFAADPEIGLSSMLATLEDIYISSPGYIMFCGLPPEEPATWRKFFEEFRNVKVLRLLHGTETQVVKMLRQPTINTLPPQEEDDPEATIPSSMQTITNGSELIFPSLEEIVLYVGMPFAGMPYIGMPNRSTIGGTVHASILKLFGPFVTARQEVGRPVKVFWSTDGQVPEYSVSDTGFYSPSAQAMDA